MSDIQLRRLDLTLLLVLDEAVRSRRFGLVAARLGLTQSAISHAMTRLREIFGDPLFLRQGNGMVPTQRALALAVPVGRVLAELRAAIGEGQSIDPLRLERTFRISAFDHAVSTLIPAALAALAKQAPLVRFALVTLSRAEAVRAVSEGRLDIAIGVFPELTEGFSTVPLSREHFVMVCRRGHPVAAGDFDLERYLALDHLLVSAAGDFEGAVDQALAKIGRRRRVVAAIPQFLAALAAVAASDTVVTVPEGVARDFAVRFDLAVLTPPLVLPDFEVVALTGPVSAADPAVRWLLQQLSGLAREAAAAGAAATPLREVRDGRRP